MRLPEECIGAVVGLVIAVLAILLLGGCTSVIPTAVGPENPIPLALTEPCDTGPWSPQTNGELATSYLAAKAALEACAGRLRAVREWPEVPSAQPKAPTEGAPGTE